MSPLNFPLFSFLHNAMPMFWNRSWVGVLGICRLQGLKVHQRSHTLEKCWECPPKLCWSVFNDRHMNISHSSTKKKNVKTTLTYFRCLMKERDSLHRSSLSHIKDTFATQSGSGFRARRKGWVGVRGVPLPRLRSERATWANHLMEIPVYRPCGSSQICRTDSNRWWFQLSSGRVVRWFIEGKLGLGSSMTIGNEYNSEWAERGRHLTRYTVEPNVLIWHEWIQDLLIFPHYYIHWSNPFKLPRPFFSVNCPINFTLLRLNILV